MTTRRVTAGSRLERRKAQTRKKLLDAARVMLAEDTAKRASVQDITEAADVGFGSFYNHFTSKDQLFIAAVADVLEETGELLSQLSDRLTDPAAGFAQSVRLATWIARARPQLSRILVRHGMSYIGSDHGLTPRILPDITAGIAAGRFRIDNPKLALAITAGSWLATLNLALLDSEFAAQPLDEQLAERLLLMFGIAPDEARKLATGPLPNLGNLAGAADYPE